MLAQRTDTMVIHVTWIQASKKLSCRKIDRFFTVAPEQENELFKLQGAILWLDIRGKNSKHGTNWILLG